MLAQFASTTTGIGQPQGGFQGTTLRTMNLGQSLANGQFGVDISGYSVAKMANPNAKWWYVKEYIGSGSTLPDIRTFHDHLMSPYQFSAFTGVLPTYGCSLEYTFAELVNGSGLDYEMLKMGWGGQKFGTDANPGTFYVSADGLTLGTYASDVKKVLTNLKSRGVEFDAVLWMHGESDARDENASLIGYTTMFNRFLTHIIYSIYPNIKLLFRKFPVEATAWIEDVPNGGTVGGIGIFNDQVDAIVLSNNKVFSVDMPVPHTLGDPTTKKVHPSSPDGNDEMATAFHSKVKTVLGI